MSNISRRKSNESIKFGQLTEYKAALVYFLGLRNFYILIQCRMELKKKTKRPHNANALNIARLVSPMVWSCNLCNVNNSTRMNELISLEICTKFLVNCIFKKTRKYRNFGEWNKNKTWVKKNIFSLFRENVVGGSLNQKNKLISPNVRDNFFQKSCWKWRRETSSRPLPENFNKSKASGQQISFNIFW